jgi:hypothetical protein
MSNNVPKRLADVIPTSVSRDFEPSGWVGKDGRFHPEVKLRGEHWKAASVSVTAVLLIERDLPGLVAAAIEAATDPAVESAVRAETAKRAAAKAGTTAPAAAAAAPVSVSPLAAALAARK